MKPEASGIHYALPVRKRKRKRIARALRLAQAASRRGNRRDK